jgi:hypothetical protein
MKLQDHNVAKAVIDALASPALGEPTSESLEPRDGMPVVKIDGIKCAIDVAGRIVQAGDGHRQRWFEIVARDVTPRRYLPPEEQAALDEVLEDWWMVTTSKRTCFVRNRSHGGAIKDFLSRFPGETAHGMDAPEAELARGFEFVDDEADKLRNELAELHSELHALKSAVPVAPAPDEKEESAELTSEEEKELDEDEGLGRCKGECTCGGCYEEPTKPKPVAPVKKGRPGDFYFGIGDTPDGTCVCLVPKRYWDANVCMEDNHFDVPMPEYLGEPDAEATWILPDGKLGEDVAIDMVVLGYDRNQDFEDFLTEAE